ncbi:hypothetical protein CYMTET_27901 [Cymbomonas tetramitiformis]|uniref:Wax synthase domain-containing protein n=1 Tax=Cymbomonas tetramitiformis TaxID=36881 RepID=A0AAE0KWQ0_9CHLO|nr:hypothetical protein CYMTET_27901 [Cymbomonas tetramitiformis]
MAGSTLRMLVYEPLTEGKLVERKEGQTGTTRTRAPVSVTLLAVVATFTMSGVMHELVIWHATGTATMEWLGFFTLHGFAVAGEQVLTKVWRKCMVGRNPFPPAVSWVCTMVFLLASAEWLFFPPCTRSGLDKEVINSIQAALL